MKDHTAAKHRIGKSACQRYLMRGRRKPDLHEILLGIVNAREGRDLEGVVVQEDRGGVHGGGGGCNLHLGLALFGKQGLDNERTAFVNQ